MVDQETIESLSHLDPEVDETTVDETDNAEEVEETEDNPLAFLDDDSDDLPEDDGEEEEKISADVDDEDSDEADDSGDDSSVADEEEEKETKDEPIPTELLVEAGKAGLTAEQVKAFPNANSLKAAIALVQKPVADDVADKGADKGEADEDGEDGSELKLEDFEFEVPDDFDDDTKDLLEGMAAKFNEHLKSQISNVVKQLGNGGKAQAELAELKQQVEANAQREFFEWYDSRIEGLDDGWKDVFGKGSMDSLETDSKAAQNRINLTIEMDRLHQAHPEWGKEKLLDSAIKLTFPEEHEKITTEKSSRKRTEYRENRVTQKPTARNTSIGEPPSKKKAIGFAAKALRKLGFS